MHCRCRIRFPADEISEEYGLDAYTYYHERDPTQDDLLRHRGPPRKGGHNDLVHFRENTGQQPFTQGITGVNRVVKVAHSGAGRSCPTVIC
jgi:hypothetical protein